MPKRLSAFFRAARTVARGQRGAVAVVALRDVERMRAEHGSDTVERLVARIDVMLREGLPRRAAISRAGSARFQLVLPDEPLASARASVEAAVEAAARATVDVKGERPGVSLAHALVPWAGRDPTRALAVADRMVVADAPPPDPGDALAYHLQPIRRLSDGTVIGFEALLRWHRPDGRTLAANRFADFIERLPAAETDALAARAVAAARGVLARTDAPFVAFNVGIGTLDGHAGRGAAWRAAVLDALPPDRVVLEILEGSVTTRMTAVTETVTALRSRGVRIALDDFGTGQSNLDRFVALRPDIVKLDRVLRPDGGPATGAIVASVAGLCRHLGVMLVAEGLESAQEVEAARACGVEVGQGYHLGRPGPVETWRVKPAA